MILEYIEGQLSLDSEAMDTSVNSYKLTPVNNHKYDCQIHISCSEEQQQYIIVDKDAITINASWFGESPLFYFVKSGSIIISSSFEKLLSKLKERRFTSLEFDRTAILESIIFDNPLRARTLYKDIRKIISGKRIKIDLSTSGISEESIFVLPFDKGEKQWNRNSLLKEATDILDGLSAAFKSIDGDVLLPLSGGLDSRLLGCLLNKNNISFEAITFGSRESSEPYVARKVARKFGIPIRYLELKNNYYKKYGDEVTWLTGGFSSPMALPPLFRIVC